MADALQDIEAAILERDVSSSAGQMAQRSN
jgi:hypothetical protein